MPLRAPDLRGKGTFPAPLPNSRFVRSAASAIQRTSSSSPWPGARPILAPLKWPSSDTKGRRQQQQSDNTILPQGLGANDVPQDWLAGRTGIAQPTRREQLSVSEYSRTGLTAQWRTVDPRIYQRHPAASSRPFRGNIYLLGDVGDATPICVVLAPGFVAMTRMLVPYPAQGT